MISFRVFTTVAGRLSLGFGVLIVLMFAMGVVGVLELQRMSERMHRIAEVDNQRSALARDVLETIDTLAIRARNIALTTDIPGVDQEKKAFEASVAEYEQREKALRAAIGEGRADGAQVQLLEQIQALAGKAMPLVTEAVELGMDGDNVAATLVLTAKLRPIETEWRGKVRESIELQARATAEAVATAEAARKRALVTVGLLLVAAVTIGVLVAWRLISSIKSPVDRALLVAERIAHGDLTSSFTLNRHDELGRLLQAIDAMQDRLRTLVGDIRDTSDSIKVASAEVAAGNGDLSQRTELAAANLEATSSNVEQLNTTVRASAEAAAQANELAVTAREVAQRGGSVVERVVSTMDQIQASSRKIADIIGTIDGIAFQTNILALNAAVEAARAGDQGRGFAVVAGEVRNLAQRSAAAAREIKVLINSSVERVESGAQLVNGAGTTMKEIMASVGRVSQIVSEISESATRQSRGVGEVNGAVNQLDQMTQQNAALVEQTSAAAQSLQGQASKLSELVSTFKLTRA